MYDVKDFLERALRQQRNMLKIYEKQLKNLPEGSLSVSCKKGVNYYCKHKDGLRTYIGKEDSEEVQALQHRKILSEIIKRMGNNNELILDFLKSYEDPSPYSIEEGIGKAYRNQNVDFRASNGKRSSKKWCDQPYQRNTVYPEQLTQKTLRGDYVRSKSEVIIANTYFGKDTQYRYEEIIRVGNKTFSPDFTILIPRLNKIKYHEHFGMMHDKQYRERAFQKIEAYIAAGYRPYEDILFTFDDLDGNINTQILDKLIDAFCS